MNPRPGLRTPSRTGTGPTPNTKLKRERYYALGFTAVGVDYDVPTLNLSVSWAGNGPSHAP